MSLKSKLTKLSAGVAMATAAAVGLAGPAQAEAFHNSTMNISWTPWASPTSQGAQYWTVSKGTTVAMRCWTTGAYQDGTGKWFKIDSLAYPYTEGYVPANAVSNQWQSSPPC